MKNLLIFIALLLLAFTPSTNGATRNQPCITSVVFHPLPTSPCATAVAITYNGVGIDAREDGTYLLPSACPGCNCCGQDSVMLSFSMSGFCCSTSDTPVGYITYVTLSDGHPHQTVNLVMSAGCDTVVYQMDCSGSGGGCAIITHRCGCHSCVIPGC
jgi:hypothetical protein